MISIVVPLFNEEESIQLFHEELMKHIPSFAKEYEILYIDDGSTDKSLEILKQLSKNSDKIKIFSFRRNLGKAEALTYGFLKAKGEYIVTLDADLQDRPSEISRLLEKSKQGVEVVCGYRKNQQRKGYMIAISKIFNSILNFIFDLRIHDYNCGLKAYTREAAKSLRLYGGLHRFIPLIAYQQGFTVGEVVVNHAPRQFGKSKYSFSKFFKDLPDMFTMLFLAKYSKRPLHFFGILGLIFIVIGLVILGYLSYLHFIGQSIMRRPILFFGMLSIISGFQIFFTGFLADLMINISHTPKFLDEENLHYPLKYTNNK
jgi:glycosyltransferase involved in cell wall biosynthesis